MGVTVTQEGSECLLEVGEITVEATELVGDREGVSLGDAPYHGDLSRSLKSCSVNRGEGCLFVDRDRFDIAPQFAMDRMAKRIGLLLSPPQKLVDQTLRSWLVEREALVMGIEKPIAIGHLAFDAELADVDHVGLHQSFPDGGESVLGDERDEVVSLQVDEVVAPAQMDPSHVDPVQQVSGIISEVPQLFGQMDLGVEGVRYVEDDPLAGFLG